MKKFLLNGIFCNLDVTLQEGMDAGVAPISMNDKGELNEQSA